MAVGQKGNIIILDPLKEQKPVAASFVDVSFDDIINVAPLMRDSSHFIICTKKGARFFKISRNPRGGLNINFMAEQHMFPDKVVKAAVEIELDKFLIAVNG